MRSQDRPNSPSKGTTEYGFSIKRGAGITTPGNVTGKMMEFEQFLAALEQIARKLMPELDINKGLEKLIEEWILPLDKVISSERSVSNETLQTLMQLLKENGMTKFLGVMHKSLYPYYKMYANSKSLMSLEGFVKICSVFEIFPDVVTKPRLNRIFYTIASISTGSQMAQANETASKASILIDDHLFVEAIALCAFEVPYREPQPSYFEKVFFIRNKNIRFSF